MPRWNGKDDRKAKGDNGSGLLPGKTACCVPTTLWSVVNDSTKS